MKSLFFASTIALAAAVNQQDVNICFSVNDCSCNLAANNNNLWSVLTGEAIEADVNAQTTNMCKENQQWFDQRGSASVGRHYKRTSSCNDDGFLVTTVQWYPRPATRPTAGYCSQVATHTSTLIADGRCRMTEGPNPGTFVSYHTVSQVPCTNALLKKYSASGCAPQALIADPTYTDLMYVADSPKRQTCNMVATGNYYTTHSRCDSDGVLETAITTGQTKATCDFLDYPTGAAIVWHKHNGRCLQIGTTGVYYNLPAQNCVAFPASTSDTDYNNNIAFFEGQRCENRRESNQHLKRLRETQKGVVDGFECIVVAGETTSYRMSSFCNVNRYLTSVRSVYTNTMCLGTPMYNEEFASDAVCHGYVAQRGATVAQQLFSYQILDAEITRCNDDHWNIFSSNDCSGYPLESGFVTSENGTCVKQFGENRRINHGCTTDGLFLTSQRTPFTTNDCGTERTVGVIAGVPTQFLHDGNCHTFVSGTKQFSYKASLSECRPAPAFTFVNGIDDDKTGMIAGIVVGGCGFLFIVMMVIYCVFCKKEPEEEEEKNIPE